jgi:hypothetical protein
MQGETVEERVVTEVMRGVETLPMAALDEATRVSWFAARQPAIVRYLALRCGDGTDAMAVALHYATVIERSFHEALGGPPPRVIWARLGCAEAAFTNEARTRGRDGGGLVERQPALAQLIADVVASPPVPLADPEAARMGVALAAVVYALDEAAYGRPVP